MRRSRVSLLVTSAHIRTHLGKSLIKSPPSLRLQEPPPSTPQYSVLEAEVRGGGNRNQARITCVECIVDEFSLLLKTCTYILYIRTYLMQRLTATNRNRAQTHPFGLYFHCISEILCSLCKEQPPSILSILKLIYIIFYISIIQRTEVIWDHY